MVGAGTYLGGFAQSLEQRGEEVLYTFSPDGLQDGETLSYVGLHRRASAIARRLREAVAPGDRVILMAPPGLDYIAGFFACMYTGVIAVPAYPPSSFHDRDNMNRLFAVAIDAGTTTGLVTRDILAGLESFDFGNVDASWVTIDGDDGSESDEPGQEGLLAARPEDIAFLQYTSGSTGNPRGVIITQGNLAANISMTAQGYGYDPLDPHHFVSWLPPYHDMGLIGAVLTPAWLGFPVTFMPPSAFLRRPVRWLQAIDRVRGTLSAGPNFAFDICVDKISDEDLEQLDLSSWRIAVNGAEPVRAATLERFVRRFSPCGFRRSTFYPSFGMAEATLMVTTGSLGSAASIVQLDADALRAGRAERALPDDEAVTVVTCGRPSESVEVSIVDPGSREPVADGQVGEIVVSGPQVAAGYWTETPDAATTFRDGSVATGDLGVFIDGELAVTGRIKDVLVLRGRNYYPQDIERSAEAAHPALRRGNAAAFTVDHEAGVDLVVVLEVVPAKLDDPHAVVDHVRRSITSAHGVAASAIVLVSPGRIPKTSSGKVRRGEARKRHLAGQLEPVMTWSKR